MNEVIKALTFIAIGMSVSEVYNMRIWRRYRDGRKDEKTDHDGFRDTYRGRR